MKRISALFLVLVFLVSMVGLADAASKKVPRMTKEKLLSIIDDSNIIVVDVRKATDWRASEFMIKDAVRVNAREFDKFMKKYPTDRTLVFYCA